jgi:hypothetical protein
MANYTPSTLTGDLAPVNAELEKIASAIDDQADRNPAEGEANQMENTLDMNSQSLINLPEPVNANDAARLVDVQVAVSTGLPDQTGNAGKFLSTDGSVVSWEETLTSVNGQTGVVVLDTDDIDDSASTNKYVTQEQKDKIDDLEQTTLTSVANVADLRDFEPTADNQQISLVEHTSDGKGGGVFYFDATDSTTADNNGTVIVTGNNARWKRIYETLDVTMFGAIGDGVTDDTASFQAAFSESKNIYMPNTGSYYILSERIPYQSGGKYYGDSSDVGGTSIFIANNSNLVGAVFVPKDWVDNQTSAGIPVEISGLFINGNKANQSTNFDGILIMNYRSKITNNSIFSMSGNGIRFTDQNSASVSISGTAVENWVYKNTITQCNLDGIKVDNNSNALTDGKCFKNVVGVTGEKGINIRRGGGWQVEGNQVYNTGFDGIAVEQGFNTSVRGNEVQGWGGSSTTGTRYACVIFSINSDSRPCIIESNNVVQNIALTSGSTYYQFGITTGSGVTDAKASVISNIGVSTDDAAERFLNVTGSGQSDVYVSGNHVSGINENKFIFKNSNDVVRHASNSFDEEIRSLQGLGTPTVLHGNTFETSAGFITLSDFTDGYEGQKVTIIFKNSNYTVDFTGTNLYGNQGADWSPAVNDHMVCTLGTSGQWFCMISDNT